MYLHIVTFNCVYGIIDTKPTCASQPQVCSDVLRLLLNAPWAEFVSADSVFSPSPKRMESNSMPRKVSLTSENLVGIKDGCTLIVLFFFDQVKVSESDEVIGGCWIYCSTCIFIMNLQSMHLAFESIYRNSNPQMRILI